MRHVVNPVAESGEEDEEEAAQPERPTLPTAQEDDADDRSRDAQGVDDLSIPCRVTLEERLAHRKVHDQHNLKQERPDNVEPVKVVHVSPD